MILFLYIILVCYAPIIDHLCPVLDLGKGIPNLDMSRIVFLFLFIAAGFSWSMKKIRLRVLHPWIIVLFCFASYAVASLTWSDRGYSVSNIQGIFDSYFTPIFIVIIGMSLFSDEKNIKKFMWHMCIVIICMAVLSVRQFITADRIIESPTMLNLRATGTLGNANLLAIFFVLNIPAFLYSYEKKSISGKLLTASLIALSIGVFTTLSRKGFVMYFLSMVLYYFFSRNYKKVFIFTILGVAAIALLMSYSLMRYRFNGKELAHQFKGRDVMALAGLNMLKKNPVLGLGFQGYYDNYGKYVAGAGRIKKYSAHNIFITALVNYGILGFPVFLLIFILPLKHAYGATVKRNSDKNIRELARRGCLVLATMLPFMLGGFFAGGLFYQTSAIYLLYTYVTMFFSKESTLKARGTGRFL